MSRLMNCRCNIFDFWVESRSTPSAESQSKVTDVTPEKRRKLEGLLAAAVGGGDGDAGKSRDESLVDDAHSDDDGDGCTAAGASFTATKTFTAGPDQSMREPDCDGSTLVSHLLFLPSQLSFFSYLSNSCTLNVIMFFFFF